MSSTAADSIVRRIVLIGAAAVAYVVNFWPAPLLRDAVLSAFGNPSYKGVWLLIPHLFLYTTLQALVCLLLWTALVRAGWMPKLQLSLRWRTFAWGLGAGLFSIAVMVAFFFATGQGGAFHSPHVDPWNAGANIFSNFFEGMCIAASSSPRLLLRLASGRPSFFLRSCSARRTRNTRWCCKR